MNTLDKRKLVAEFLGTAGLVCAVVGSGIMAERLAGGNGAVALLANMLATIATLFVLIVVFGPISGAHFNPAVSVCVAARGGLPWGTVPGYVVAQCAGGALGAVVANVMFGLSPILISQTARWGGTLWLGEFVATFGLLSVIWGTQRAHAALGAVCVAAFIGGAYWFTSSTSFANPAVTLGRTLSDTFAGIAPTSAAGFIVAQMLGALAGTVVFAWLLEGERK